MPTRDIVVIGASADGVQTLRELVRPLPADLPAALFVVLHTGPYGGTILPRILSRAGQLSAETARDGQHPRHGSVYAARRPPPPAGPRRDARHPRPARERLPPRDRPALPLGGAHLRAARHRHHPLRHAPDPIDERPRLESDDPRHIGTPSVHTCPDCGGTLMELVEGELVRYRCHVGHAFTPLTLLNGQQEQVEEALWSAIRRVLERPLEPAADAAELPAGEGGEP